MMGVAAGKTNLLRHGVRVEHEGAVKLPILFNYTAFDRQSQCREKPSRPSRLQGAVVSPTFFGDLGTFAAAPSVRTRAALCRVIVRT